MKWHLENTAAAICGLLVGAAIGIALLGLPLAVAAGFLGMASGMLPVRIPHLPWQAIAGLIIGVIVTQFLR